MRTRQNLLDIYPLTPIQQGILYHALAADDDPYVLRACFRIAGAVDARALQRAWQAVVDRHEALRADIEWTKSAQPVQLVFRSCPVALDELDWPDVPPGELDARLRAVVADQARRFSLQRSADQRIVLVRTAPDTSYLVWVFHHALLDGWSIANVLSEVLRGYQAVAAGGAPALPPVPSHASYLAWLGARPPAEAEAYWRDALAGYEPPEFPPRAAGAPGYAERSVVLDDASSARLRARASDARVTLATCLAAAHALLIRAYTGASDVVLGATVSGRPAELPGAEAMVGAFINTVPVRVRIPDRGGVVPWLAQLQRDASRRVAFEHLGLPRILDLAGRPAGQPLFESILVFESFPVSHVLEQADALAFAVERHPLFDASDGVTVGRGRNHYPLTVVVLPGRRIELIVAYHRDRVSDATAAAIADRLLATVRALAAEDALAAVLDAGAAPPERRRVPAEPTRAIHDRIAHWADTTPGAIAVRCDDAVVRYAELEARANRLAHRLRAAGAAPGSRVGLILPRTPDFVVALYAALKLGAAYVPLPPEAPRARLVELIDDAGLAAIVAAGDAPDGLGAPVVRCDDERGPAGDAPAIRTAVHPESPAYVIYTSGSTGAPKGVVISHRALDHYVTSILARLTPPAAASMAMISTVAADLGHTALFGALCAGGTLHLVSDDRAADPDGFADDMARHQVASLKIVPGQLWGLMQTAAPDRALPSHTLVIGGEVAPPALLDHLRRQTRCRVINHYGPTETTVGVLTYPLDGGELPLGTPLPHARAYVLGPDLRAMPAGATGEIHVGGQALAAGYLRRPALTAERFVPDPHAGEPGARMYRTGDRGRIRDDGAIEFLGRTDDQIKLRGFRVELGEIRAALVALPGVSDARVVARTGPAGTPQLCAYLTGTATGLDLAAALRARLPEHMVPSAFVWLERFPVTRNGKLDLARLPEPAAPGAVVDAAPGAVTAGANQPASDAERALAAIWSEILGRPEVGRDDHFFHLGGDSILALKVVARARRAGYKLTPKLLSAHPTLAEAARAAQPIEPAPAAPAVAAAPASGPSPEVLLTPIQHHFFERQVREPHHYNQAILLALDPPIALDAIAGALDQLIARHDALRLRFDRAGDRWRATCAGAAPGERVRRVELPAGVDPGAAIERACDELQRGFDLARGPLVRAAHFDLGPGRPPRLLLCAHHLVVDGVSWRILLEDLAELVAGDPAALPPPTTPFAQWTERLAAHSRSTAVRDELAYWRAVIADPALDPTLDPALVPPGAARTAANLVGDAATLSIALDEPTTAALLAAASRDHRATLHELLLAALTTALCRAWGRPSVAITVEGHGREDRFDGVDLSRTVGWLATTYPVRLTAGRDRAATVRAVARELRAVPAGGIGYGVLRHLAPDTPLAGAPAPRVTFNYLGQFDDSFAHGGFSIASEPTGRRRSPHARRDSWFVVNAVIYDRSLRVDWEYSRALHDRAEVEPLIAAYRAELCALASGGAP